MNQSSGRKLIALSNWVIRKDFNKGTVYNDIGRVYENQQQTLGLKGEGGIWRGPPLIEGYSQPFVTW